MRYPLAVRTTKMAESGRKKRSTLSPYRCREDSDRMTMARMTVGSRAVQHTQFHCPKEGRTLVCQTVIDVVVMVAKRWPVLDVRSARMGSLTGISVALRSFEILGVASPVPPSCSSCSTGATAGGATGRRVVGLCGRGIRDLKLTLCSVARFEWFDGRRATAAGGIHARCAQGPVHCNSWPGTTVANGWGLGALGLRWSLCSVVCHLQPKSCMLGIWASSELILCRDWIVVATG
jgi:hypothetical protein